MQGLCQGAFLPSLGGRRRASRASEMLLLRLVEALEWAMLPTGLSGTRGQTIPNAGPNPGGPNGAEGA
jgi:hypothetical protein